VEIHWVDFGDIAERQRIAVEERLRELAEGYSDLIDVRLTAHTTPHHRHGAQEVRITAAIRGKEIIAARTRDELGLALDEAMDAFERELRERRDRKRQRRSEQPAEPPELGIVDHLVADEDYGFLLTDAGERVYFHRNALKHGLSFDALFEGQRVALNLEAGDRGLQATVVFPAPADSAVP